MRKLALFAFLLSSVAAYGSDCKFSGITFDQDLKHLEKTFSKEWMGYPLPNQFDFSTAIANCLKAQDPEILKQEYITGCGFERNAATHAKRLYVYPRHGKAQRISFILDGPLANHDEILAQLKKSYGAPMRTGHYFVEDTRQEVLSWNRKDCRIIYDFQPNKKRAHSLIMEALPSYQGGFNPSLINEATVIYDRKNGF